LTHVFSEVSCLNSSLKLRDHGRRIEERVTDPREVRYGAIIGLRNNVTIMPLMNNCVSKVSKFLQIVPVSTYG